jgi:phosphatidylcholine synthase
VAGAWLVHAYTASGALFGFLALTSIADARYRDAFAWLAVALAIDATDGMFARAVDVKTRLPGFDGAKLDDIVDYLTYVLVPAFLVWHAPLVPREWATPMAGAMLLSSAYRFNTASAKTADHFFTGFPSYWNIVVFYLYVIGWPLVVNAAVLALLAALVFVPIRYVYPSRTPAFRLVTVTLAIAWGAIALRMLWLMPEIPALLVWLSLLFPAYYVALSLSLDLRRHKT